MWFRPVSLVLLAALIRLNMTARNGDDVSGTINWATLSTITKFRGTVSGNTLKIEEYEIITGDDVGTYLLRPESPSRLSQSRWC